MTLDDFEIELRPGHLRVRLGGEDISDSIEELAIESTRTTVPALTFTIRPKSVIVNGAGYAEEDNFNAVTDFLDGLDLEELESAALANSGYGMSVTESMISLLKERARGD